MAPKKRVYPRVCRGSLICPFLLLSPCTFCCGVGLLRPAPAAPMLCPHSLSHCGSNLPLYCFISHSFLDQMPAGVLCAQQWGTRDERGAGPRRSLEQCALPLREEVARSRAGAPPNRVSITGPRDTRHCALVWLLVARVDPVAQVRPG